MATFAVTTSNWNSSAFWSGISTSAAGQTLDFSGLPGTYSVTIDDFFGVITLSDGSSTYTVKDSASGVSADATMGGSSLLSDFDNIQGSGGDDTHAANVNSFGDETIFGGAGDDSITSGGGDSYVDGGTGNDTIFANFYASVRNQYHGGSGTDWLIIDGTLVENYAYDINLVSGTDNYANIYSGIENFALGDANDSILGDGQDNVFDGGDGNDTLTGGAGGDSLIGGAGDDSISGGDGADFLKSGSGQDTLDGGAGNDTLMNAAGDDSLVGGAGDDLIVATQGNDTLEGGDGNDTLMGGTGNDSIDGGADNDLILGDLAGVEFNATGTNGAGVAAGITDFPATALTYELTFSSTDDVSSGVTPLASFASTANDNAFLLMVSNGNLEVLIYPSANLFTGVDATGYFNGDVNTIALTWDSTSGALDIYANGANIYSGTYSQGVSIGQNGTFVLGQEQDSLGGGFDGSQSFQGTIHGARLYDDVRSPAEILDSTQAPVADTSDPNLIANWVADPNAATFTDQTGSYTMAMSGDVTPTWSEGDDTLRGGSGQDTIYGGGGADSIEGRSGMDTIYGGDGADTIDGGFNTDHVYAGAGDDLITDSGGSGSDDTIYGEAGNDTISGGTREDYLDGGDDADTFLIEDTFGNDTIVGGEGGTDNDVIDLSALDDPVTVTYGADDESGTITDGIDTITFSEIERIITTDEDDSVDATAVYNGIFGDNPGIDIETRDGDDTILSGFGGDTIDGGDGADSIDGDYGDDSLIGGEGDDTLIGSSGNDTLEGGNDDDALQSGNEADSLDGGDGADTLDAGSGDDTLLGGTGDDALTGGDGNDTFIFNPGDGVDTITDFNTGNTGALWDGNTANNDFIDLSLYYTNLAELRADFADDDELNQSTGDFSDNTSMGGGGIVFSGADQSSFTADNTGVICFAAGSRILTAAGEVPIERLRAGDLVQTKDNGLQPLTMIASRKLSAQELQRHPNLTPIELKPGALGGERRLIVSPQHAMLVSQNGGERLVRARQLSRLKGGAVRVMMGCRQVVYFHLVFDAHQIVFADGRPSESFYPGPLALAALNSDARAEFEMLFPDLWHEVSSHGRVSGYTAARSNLPTRHLPNTLAHVQQPHMSSVTSMM